MYHVGSCPRRHENTQIGFGWRPEENSRDRSLPRLVPNPSGLRLTSTMIGFHIPITIIFFDSLNVYRTSSSSEMAMYAVYMTVDDVWWTGGHERCDLLVLIIPGQSICHTLATPGLYAGADGTPLLLIL